VTRDGNTRRFGPVFGDALTADRVRLTNRGMTESSREVARPGPFGVVVIGRNEGQRLRVCLESLSSANAPIVYVDSASTDGSPEVARRLGAEVIELDPSRPFTAARGRNAGWRSLRERHPELEFVQFVDGDCEVIEGWLDVARATLAADPGLAAVFGRRRERYPERSLYNRACDIEWDTPVGEAMEFGGEVMMRLEAISTVGGYDDQIIAAEDTDLAIRMRRLGWRLLRLDAPMSIHDAAIERFDQWWKRMVRGGHGTAEIEALHSSTPEFHRRGWTRSTLFWGATVPAGGLALALPTLGLSVLGVGAGYGLLFAKTERAARRSGRTPEEARAWAVNCTLGKLPEAVGHIRYWRNRMARRASTLIEYK